MWRREGQAESCGHQRTEQMGRGDWWRRMETDGRGADLEFTRQGEWWRSGMRRRMARGPRRVPLLLQDQDIDFTIPALRVAFDRFWLVDQNLSLCESETFRRLDRSWRWRSYVGLRRSSVKSSLLSLIRHCLIWALLNALTWLKKECVSSCTFHLI